MRSKWLLKAVEAREASVSSCSS